MSTMLPEDHDIFDIFFNIETNTWKPWAHVYNFYMEEKGGFAERMQKNILTSVCWT